MDENKKENPPQTSDSTINKEALMNLAGNLLKGDDSISSIMKMATNLLGDGSLVNTAKELNKLKQNASLISASTNEVASSEFVDAQEELTNQFSAIPATLASQFSAIQAELAKLKAQNAEFVEQISYIKENYKKKKDKKDKKK